MTDTMSTPRERPEDDEVLIPGDRPVVPHGPGRERPEDDLEFFV